MKILVKSTVLILLLLFLFTAASCNHSSVNHSESAETNQSNVIPPEIIGSWQSSVSMGSTLDYYANHYYAEPSRLALVKDIVGECEYKVFLRLNEDGTLLFEVDRDSVDAINEVMKSNTPKLLAAQLKMSLEDLERILRESDLTIEEYMEKIGVELTFEDCRDKIPFSDTTGKYMIDGDKLYVGLGGREITTEGYFVYSVNNDALIITDAVGDDFEDLLPLTFKPIEG